MKCVNLIDGSNIFFICWCVFSKNREEINPGDEQEFFKIYFMKLKMFLTAKTNIIAFEGKNSREWRKKIYPEYKANRASMKAQPLGKYFYDYLEQVIEMSKNLPCKILRVDNCEGDDVIYTLAEKFSKLSDEIRIISADADLTQIGNFFPNVKIYHPLKKCFVTPNPDVIYLKALAGDTSDNIKFKKGLGQKVALKMKENYTLWRKWVVTKEDEQRLNDIRKIVDLRFLPLNLKNSIIDSYNNTDFNYPNPRAFYKDGYLLHFLTQTCNSWNSINDVQTNNLSPAEDVVPEDVFPKFVG